VQRFGFGITPGIGLRLRAVDRMAPETLFGLLGLLAAVFIGVITIVVMIWLSDRRPSVFRWFSTIGLSVLGWITTTRRRQGFRRSTVNREGQ